MQDPPPGIFATKDHSAAPEALCITELEGDEDESGTQRLDPQVHRNQPLVRGPGGRVCADVGENGEEC